MSFIQEKFTNKYPDLLELQTTKFIHITDPHLPPVDSVPQGRTLNLPFEILEKFKEVYQACRMHNAPLLVSGDWFHYKEPSKYSPEDLNFWIQNLSAIFNPGTPEEKVMIYGIPGNHDMSRSSFKNIYKSPYLTLKLGLKGVYVDVSENPQTFQHSGEYNCPQDLLENGYLKHKVPNPSFTINGVHYLPIPALCDSAISLNQSIKQRAEQFVSEKTVDSVITLLHPDAYPNLPPIPGIVSLTYAQLSHNFWRSDVLVLGHVHLSYSPETTMVKEEGSAYSMEWPVITSKPWSLTRVAKEYHATTDVIEHQHIPSYSLIEVSYFYKITEDNVVLDKREFNISYVELGSVKPARDVFRGDDLKKLVERSQKIQDFVSSIKQDSISEGSLFSESADQEFSRSRESLPAKVVERIQHYLHLSKA